MEINLTEEQKKQIVDQANAEPVQEEGLTTEVVQAADDPDLVKQIAQMTPKQLLEANVAASYRSLMKLEGQLQGLSKKNIIKLLLATLKLPEEGMRVNFGGTAQDKDKCMQAFVQSQVARNSFVYVTSTKAYIQAQLAKKAEQEEKEKENGGQ